MTRPMRTLLHAVLLSSLLTAACASQGPGPTTAPAADHAAYATAFPTRLKGTSDRYAQEMGTLQRLKKDLKTYPEALKDPDWEVVEEIYELADEDGKSSHYAATMRENTVVEEFFAEGEKPLASRTAASVNYQAKQKGCDLQLYGAVEHGLEKAVEDRLKERREEASLAQQRLDELDLPPGDANVKVLREQSQEITTISHLVNVALPQRHQELQNLVADSDRVKRTLEKRKKALTAQAEAKEKAAAKARAAELESVNEALAELDDDVRTAETLLSLSEQQVEDARSAYSEEFDVLIDLVEERQGKKQEEPETPSDKQDK